MGLADKAHFLFRLAAPNILKLSIDQSNANFTASLVSLEIYTTPKVLLPILCDHAVIPVLVTDPNCAVTEEMRFSK